MTKQKDSLYVKACVIANGIQDQQGDVITKKDIKQIFTNSLDVGFDINHDNIRQDGIYSLEQYISKSDEQLGDHIVPAGSWMTVLRVDNPDVQSMIKKHELRGVSITAYPEKGSVIKRSNPKVILYKDIQEKDRIHPKEISLVERPSNMLPLEIMEYDDYISKSVKENNYMTNETEDEKIMKQSTINKLVDILQQVLTPSVQKGDEAPVEATINAEPEETTEPEPTVDESEPEEVEEPVAEEEVEEPVETEEETPEETEEETEESQDSDEESVQKMMQPDPNMGMGGSTADQAIVQIAQICAKVLQGQQQQQQQPPQQGNGIMQSEDPDPTEPIKKGETQLTEKATGKLDNVVSQDYIDRTYLFAKQTGRDPITGEKIYT